MSKLGTMKSSPGWVSQKKKKRSQVQEGRTLAVVVPGKKTWKSMNVRPGASGHDTVTSAPRIPGTAAHPSGRWFSVGSVISFNTVI